MLGRHTWCFCIVGEVNNDPEPNLSHLFGLLKEACMQLLHQAGLVKQKNFKDGPGYVVNVEGWNGLIDKYYYLSDLVERVNKTKLRRNCYCFISIGNKHSKVIFHPPKD